MNLFIFVIIFIYTAVSLLIFNRVFETSKTIVDELFHVPQGLQYCNGNFSTWDPKITTLPGLYVISSLIFGPWKYCTVYSLRLTNLIASVLNLYLLIRLIHKEQRTKHMKESISVKTVLSAVNLSLLPPLYFFSHLYYTDTISITFVLLLVLSSKTDHHFFAGVFGGIAIIIRQTNVIWVGMVFGNLLLNLFIIHFGDKKLTRKYQLTDALKDNISYNINDFIKALKNITKRISCIKLLIKDVILSLFCYIFVLLMFISFLLINGSLVVGDKKAHVATLHIPQLFYFSLFYLIFNFAYNITKIKSFIQFCISKILYIVIIFIFIVVTIHFNTIVHPYLLADNRHYIFYIWNRWFNKYNFAKYVTSVAYIFSLYTLFYDLLKVPNFSFIFMYVPCLLASLVLQQLIEFRYFLLPYIILKTKQRNGLTWKIFIEFVMFIIINYLSFDVFFKKEIFWTDFDDVQRLIW